MKDKWSERGGRKEDSHRLYKTAREGASSPSTETKRLAADFEKCTLPTSSFCLFLSPSLFADVPILRVATCYDPVPLGDLTARFVLNSCVNNPASPLLIIIALAVESLIEEK